ncbi:MAG: molybdenum cofactor guanylyltransferase [Candidatus Marinimicrobia bacterium]|nr:molybdenum cofactor guanylyltransferase [Candidatus Neomarinimicrobiota bacterium]
MNLKIIPATVFILIGGKSERFGFPKWKAKIHNQTVLDKIWNVCDIFENRVIVGKTKPHSISYPFMHDELSINAPINGLYTSLKNSKTDWVFLLSCDLPLIAKSVFETLWESKTENISAIIPKANGITQVTCGFYNKRMVPILEDEIQNENYSLIKLLENINLHQINFGDDDHFINMNTQNDYNKIINMVH